MSGPGEYENEGGHDWTSLAPGRIMPGLGRLPRKKAMLWALVLTSRGVPCRVDRAPFRYLVSVPSDSVETAINEIAAYESRNSNWPPQPPGTRPLKENTLAVLSVLVILATFYNITRLDIILSPEGKSIDWMAIGRLAPGLIAEGEWWRLITPLTLHADLAHLFANLCIGGVFVFLLCREVGSGLAWSLILASGISGNLLNALIQTKLHGSVGASTAVFGTVGILASVSLVRYRSYLQRRWPLPVAAAVALLTMLGTEGKNTDLGAHLFGFISGVILGACAEWLTGRRGSPGPLLNLLLALLCWIIVCSAWWFALETGG